MTTGRQHGNINKCEDRQGKHNRKERT